VVGGRACGQHVTRERKLQVGKGAKAKPSRREIRICARRPNFVATQRINEKSRGRATVQ